jgi:uncharacterized membrane protein YedE/YeeE
MNTFDPIPPGKSQAGTSSGFEVGRAPVKLTSALLGATFVAALGGLLFGFDTVMISGCQTQLKTLFQLNGFQQGFMTASALIVAVMMIVQVIVVWMFFPETKRVTLEEMKEHLKR